jgi:hypothetical protein
MLGIGGGAFGHHDDVAPPPPRRPRSRRWKLTFLVILLAIGVALVMGGSALAHTFAHMSGSGGCGGG